MKKLIIIPLLIAAIGAFAQTSNGSTFVSSIAVPGDHFWLPKGARELAPIAVLPGTGATDTLRSYDWSYPMTRDTSQANIVQITINFYNRNGSYVSGNLMSVANIQFSQTLRGTIQARVDALIALLRARVVPK